MEASSGKLIIVPTPIGNLGDLTLRAQQALAAADVVYAEDTRVTGKLLSALDLKKPLVRLDEQVMGQRAAEVVDRVLAGEAVCYCSDAGMPGVSDPGSRLIAAAREAGAAVEVLPGASAVTLAYVESGTQHAQFYFGGFFPRKAAEARTVLEGLRQLDAALIFYESPKRLVAALQVIAACFPYREVAVCRELTKLHEEAVRARSGDVAQIFAAREAQQPIKGEIVIVIDGPSAEEASHEQDSALEAALQAAQQLQAQGMRAKEIAARLSEEFDIPRNKAYEIAIDRR